MSLNQQRTYLTTKYIFFITLYVAILTLLSVWFFGLGKHTTLFINSLLSTSMLSLAFFLFLSINLYRGVKMKDDLGKITEHLSKDHFPDLSNLSELSPEVPDVVGGEGCGEIALGILFWIIVTGLVLIVIWFFGALLWIMVIIFAAMLYWIFFRAIRLVFKNSNACKGNFTKSVYIGLAYTLLYNFWIYGIILASHYLF